MRPRMIQSRRQNQGTRIWKMDEVASKDWPNREEKERRDIGLKGRRDLKGKGKLGKTPAPRIWRTWVKNCISLVSCSSFNFQFAISLCETKEVNKGFNLVVFPFKKIVQYKNISCFFSLRSTVTLFIILELWMFECWLSCTCAFDHSKVGWLRKREIWLIIRVTRLKSDHSRDKNAKLYTDWCFFLFFV